MDQATAFTLSMAIEAGQRTIAVLVARLGGAVIISEEELANVDLDLLDARVGETTVAVSYGAQDEAA
jgi:hypothetical protein